MPRPAARHCGQAPRKATVVTHPFTPTPQLQALRGWVSSHANPRGRSRSTRRERLRIGEVILLSWCAPKEGWRTVGVGQVSVRMQSLHPEAGPLSAQEGHRHRSWHPYPALPRWVPAPRARGIPASGGGEARGSTEQLRKRRHS